jgi:putative ATPase
MRPRTLDEVLGQDHILAVGKLLRRAIESDRFASLIFYGPPGTGKTSLANVIAKTTGSRFESLNGVESNVAEIRAKIDQAKIHRDLRGDTTILFIDAINPNKMSSFRTLSAARCVLSEQRLTILIITLTHR